MKLWNGNIPYYNEEFGQEPELLPFIVDGAKACIVVCPGGGYSFLSSEKEGTAIAEKFNENGISAFVLNYRITPYKYPSELEDVKRAMRVVRGLAGKYGYDPDKIGVMGFSAGGHLATMALTQFDEGRDDGDETDRISCRPDIGILCYAVISMGDHTHRGSRNNLLGEEYDPDLAYNLSGENSVKDNTPPCFIWHTSTDKCVPALNSICFAEALARKKIRYEMHIYPQGGHGLGLAPAFPKVAEWFGLCVGFIKSTFSIEEQ